MHRLTRRAELEVPGEPGAAQAAWEDRLPARVEPRQQAAAGGRAEARAAVAEPPQAQGGPRNVERATPLARRQATT
jgi:hypothetical protein